MSVHSLEKPSTNRYEALSPMGHTIVSEYNTLKQGYEGHVVDKDSGLKYPLSEEILDGIEAALRAESAIVTSPNADDWQRTLSEIKAKQSDYLRRLVGQAADFLILKTH